MADAATLNELDRRIAAVRANIREFIKQATASPDATVEGLVPGRISELYILLAALLKEREVINPTSRHQR